MKQTDEVIRDLEKCQARYKKFDSLFREFQRSIEHLQLNDFPLKGISLEHESGSQTKLSFLGRQYKFDFSMCYVDGDLKGKVVFERIHEDEESQRLASATYDGNGDLDLDPPEGEDVLCLRDENSCISLALNWLRLDYVP